LKRSASKKLSVAVSAAIWASTMGTSYLSVLANPLPTAGSTYPVTSAIPGYMDSAMASRMINSVTTYQAGNYYVFKVYQGMINISKASNAPGIWINPSQNTSGTAPVAPAPVTAPSSSTVTTMKSTAYLNLRTGPATSYQAILVIPKGAAVTLVEDKGEWKKITYNGKTGWSSGKYLSGVSASAPVVPPVTPTVPIANGAIYKTTGNLYLRTGPAKTAASILVMPYGANVTLVEDGGEWKKVSYNGKIGWASGKYLQLVLAATPPVVPVPPAEVVTPEPTPTPVEPAPPIEVTTPPPAEVVTPTPVPVVQQKKTTGALNMRTGAGTQYAAIMVIPKGAVVEVIGTSGKWFNITYQGKTGWSSSDYLTDVIGAYKILDVPYHSQLAPVYAPVGCEPTALLMGLQYKGIATNVSYRQFLDAMPKHPSNPEKGFAGSPYTLDNNIRTTIYPQALTDYGNTYAAGRVVNFSGSSVDDIKKEILAGNPVVVYLTVKRQAPIYANYSIEGTTQSLIKNNHAVLVTGYDSEANKLRITDPWSWSGRNEYWLDIPSFAYSYNLRNHSIVIR
jgi:uncharacterized protein YvpB